MFTSAQVKGTLYDASATNIENYANVDASPDLLSITFTGNKEAENFSYIANRLYFANANADVTGLTTPTNPKDYLHWMITMCYLVVQQMRPILLKV